MITISFDTPASGDAYCAVADVDAALIWCDAWKILSTADKEALVKAASAMADRRSFIGAKANDPQPMAFPRDITGHTSADEVFGIDAQRRATKNYVCSLIEYQLAKVNIGVQDYGLADERIKHTAMIEPDEAKFCLWDFMP